MSAVLEYYNNELCIPAHLYYHEYSDGPGLGEIIEPRFVSYWAYKKQSKRKKIEVVRQGKGEDNYALIKFDSIPPKHREEIKKTAEIPELTAEETSFVSRIRKDEKAFTWLSDYRYEDGTGLNIAGTDNITLWGNSASILNLIWEDYRAHVAERAKQGKKPLRSVFFENAAAKLRIEAVQKLYPNNLPLNGRRLQDKFDNYTRRSYESLIKRYKGNTNSVKIDDNLLRLLTFIATLPTRPYNTTVIQYYMEFMRGERELYDRKTGESFNPSDYLDENGEIIEFTEAAVWHRLNQPGIQVKLDKSRYGYKDFNDIHRPSRVRKSPNFSFSKISLDDRDLIWKSKETKKRIKAYYAYDVASGCRIGSAYSEDKNEELFLDCLRDMFVFIDRNGFGMPLEVEVENHLVNQFFDDLQMMFPILTICAPANSQQKRAEHFNRAVKYSVEKNNHPGVGRWWLKSKYNRISVDKVNDEFKQTFKERDRMIIEDIQDTLEYNNQLHPNKKKYPGMTRMDVLRNNLSPKLRPLNKALIYRYIGFETPETTINRSEWFWCQEERYLLPNPRVLELLKPNNREVTCYWMPDADGSIPEVYVYQNGIYLFTAQKLVAYQEAKAERTDEDDAAKLVQDKYVAMFDKWSKGVVEEFPAPTTERKKPISNEQPKVVSTPPDNDNSEDDTAVKVDYAAKALDDFFN